MIGRTNAGGSGSLGKSTLIVQTETGSTVTVTKGSETRGAVEKYGVWAFSGLAAGEWTVKAVKSGKTATKTVTMDGTKSVMVALAFNVIPAFTYTGDYETVDDDDNPITTTTGNWKIRFLTSGTLTFTDLRGAEDGIDVFLVGGGGGGAYGRYREGAWSPASGAGSGYTATYKGVPIEAEFDYPITIGSGGSGGTSGSYDGSIGGSTNAFSKSVEGGMGSTQETGGDGGSGGAGYQTDGKGSDGGDGPDGKYSSWHGGKGQGTTTREFADSSGKLYASGGAYNGGNVGGPNTGDGADGALKQSDGPAGGSGIVVIRNKR